jgi:endonuclease V-like protein UPF0215 family
VIDIDELNERTGLPVVTITREKPDFIAMEKALKEHFEDWEKRMEIITRGELTCIKTGHKPIYVKFAGIELDELKDIIELSTVRGALPEALRVAHLIATGITTGESYGRA